MTKHWIINLAFSKEESEERTTMLILNQCGWLHFTTAHKKKGRP